MPSVRSAPSGRLLAAVGALSGLLVIALFGLALVVRRHSAWPTASTDGILLVGILIVGLIPLLLLLVDTVIRRGGSLSFQGVKIDLSTAPSARPTLTIDTNIGASGQPVNDSSSVQILDALEKAAESDFVVVDIEDGRAWWETRLLVLVAGAARRGRPHAIVFVGNRDGKQRVYLGWSEPKVVLDELLMGAPTPRRDTYVKLYGLAVDAAKQWAAVPPPQPGNAPPTPPGLTTAPWNYSFIAWQGDKLNPFAFEQFLAAALGTEVEQTWRPGPGSPPPDEGAADPAYPGAVTITEDVLNTRLARCLHRIGIEEDAAGEEPVDVFLGDRGEFVAITREGVYVRLAPRAALLDGLVQQLLIQARA